MVGRIITPKDIHVLTPRSCEYVYLVGQTDYADVIKDLEMWTLTWIIQVTQSNHTGP